MLRIVTSGHAAKMASKRALLTFSTTATSSTPTTAAKNGIFPKETQPRFLSTLNMGGSSSSGDDTTEGPVPPRLFVKGAHEKHPYPVPNFNDTQAAYESKSKAELWRAAACFKLCQFPWLVTNAESLLNISRKIVGDRITDAILKATMFGHFCAGEDERRIRPVVERLDSYGIGSILDYAAENDGPPSAGANSTTTSAPNNDTHVHYSSAADDDEMQTALVREYDYESESQCDKHVEIFQKCIRDVASVTSTSPTYKDGYAAVKVTALGNPKLLARMSQAVVETKKLFEKLDTDGNGYLSRDEFELGFNLFFKDDDDMSVKDIFEQFDPHGLGQIDYISWSMTLKPTELAQVTSKCREVGPLALATPTEEEIGLIEAMYHRGHQLATEAAKHNVRLLIDAEQVRYQPAIDNLVLHLQQEFNAVDQTDVPIIYNTYQCYLKDAMERLRTDVHRSDRLGYHFGAKLVRGAYMENERWLAEEAGLVSPIHETIEDTHQCYNDAIDFLLAHSASNITGNRVELMCATHNQASIEKAIEAMNKYKIDKNASTICFAQLYGMSDHLTFNLGRHGYRAYKYVPYGEVNMVVPYLLRRARENSSIAGEGAKQELHMIQEELQRRRLSKSPPEQKMPAV